MNRTKKLIIRHFSNKYCRDQLMADLGDLLPHAQYFYVPTDMYTTQCLGYCFIYCKSPISTAFLSLLLNAPRTAQRKYGAAPLLAGSSLSSTSRNTL